MVKKRNGCLLWFLDAFDANKEFGNNDDQESQDNTPYIFPDPKNIYTKSGTSITYTRIDSRATAVRQPTQTAQLKKGYTYRGKNLLTNNELNFYKELKRIADKLNLTVLSKIRMADLVEPSSRGRNYYRDFGKIKAKHVDFALCNPNDLSVVLLIEVDDRTHDTREGRERDKFVESVYAETGYRLYRARGTANLERDIIIAINSK